MGTVEQFQLDAYKNSAQAATLGELVEKLHTMLKSHFSPSQFSIEIVLPGVETALKSPEFDRYPVEADLTVDEVYRGTLFSDSPVSDEIVLTLKDIISRKIEFLTAVYNESAETAKRILGITYHDVRNTLGSISGIAQLMELDAGDNPEINGSIKDIITIVKRFDVESADTMKLLRGQPLLYSSDSFDLSEMCAGILKRNSRVYQLSNIELVESVQENILCSCDEEKVRDIFTELLVNAATALEGTGGKIEVSVHLEKNNVIFRVSHDGHPIKSDVQEYIFIPFFTTKEKGRGMGLSRISRYLQDWGGSIHYSSSEKNPVEFVVSIPITQ